MIHHWKPNPGPCLYSASWAKSPINTADRIRPDRIQQYSMWLYLRGHRLRLSLCVSVSVSCAVYMCHCLWFVASLSLSTFASLRHNLCVCVPMSQYLFVTEISGEGSLSCLSVCLSVRLSVCLSVYLSVYMSVSPSICLSVFLSFWLSKCLSVYLSVCLPACNTKKKCNYVSACLSYQTLSIHLSVCLPACLLLCLLLYIGECLCVADCLYENECLHIGECLYGCGVCMYMIERASTATVTWKAWLNFMHQSDAAHTYEWVTWHTNESYCIKSQSDIDESCHMWLSHVKYEHVVSCVYRWIVSRMETWKRHATYKSVMSRLHVSYQILISHVTYKQIKEIRQTLQERLQWLQFKHNLVSSALCHNDPP